MKKYIVYIGIFYSVLTHCSQQNLQQPRKVRFLSLPSIVTFDPDTRLLSKISANTSNNNAPSAEQLQKAPQQPLTTRPFHRPIQPAQTQARQQKMQGLIKNPMQPKIQSERRPGYIVSQERQQELIKKLQDAKRSRENEEQHNPFQNEATTYTLIAHQNNKSNNQSKQLFQQSCVQQKNLQRLLYLSTKRMKDLLDETSKKYLPPMKNSYPQ